MHGHPNTEQPQKSKTHCRKHHFWHTKHWWMEKSVATAKVSMHYVPSNGHVFRHRETHIRLPPYDHDVRLCNDMYTVEWKS